MSQFVAVCPPGAPLTFYQKGLNPCCYVYCNDGTTAGVIPTSSPVSMGLQDLAWSDVNLLIGALLLSVCIAAGWNILSKLFYRG